MTPELGPRIRHEQVEVLFRQARVTFIPNLIAGPCIVYVMWGDVGHGVLAAWLSALYAVTAMRSLLVWLHDRRSRLPAENDRWGWYLAAVNAVSGSMWGVAGFAFIGDSHALGEAFVVVTIAAMTAGAVSSLAAFFPAYLVFAVPCVGPLIVR